MKKMFYFASYYILSVPVALATETGTNSGTASKFTNPLTSTKSLPALVDSFATVVLQLGVVVAALSIMYGGFLYVTAGGNEEKLASAYKTVTWSLVGTAVLVGAKVITKVITGTIGDIASF